MTESEKSRQDPTTDQRNKNNDLTVLSGYDIWSSEQGTGGYHLGKNSKIRVGVDVAGQEKPVEFNLTTEETLLVRSDKLTLSRNSSGEKQWTVTFVLTSGEIDDIRRDTEILGEDILNLDRRFYEDKRRRQTLAKGGTPAEKIIFTEEDKRQRKEKLEEVKQNVPSIREQEHSYSPKVPFIDRYSHILVEQGIDIINIEDIRITSRVTPRRYESGNPQRQRTRRRLNPKSS